MEGELLPPRLIRSQASKESAGGGQEEMRWAEDGASFETKSCRGGDLLRRSLAMRPPLSGSNPSRRPGSTDAGSETESRTSSGTFFTGDSARHPALQELEARIQRLAALPQVIPSLLHVPIAPPLR